MRFTMFPSLLAIIFLTAANILPVSAQNSAKIYAQHLVDNAVAKHPEILELSMLVARTDGADVNVIASNVGNIGNKADAADLQVIKTGNPAVSVIKDRFQIKLTLLDLSRRPMGVLNAAFSSKGQNKRGLQKNAEKIRDELSRRISNVANLIEAYQFDAKIPTKTYAQQLLDDFLMRHPEVIIMAMHVTPPNYPDNVIIASNIGRIGKKADEDDISVVKGDTRLEVNTAGDRFEVELPLQDVSGDTIGALGVVFNYKAGDDKAKFKTTAEAIRYDLRRRISNAGNLMEPFPYSQYPSNTYAQKLVDEALIKHPELLILVIHLNLPHSSDNIILGSSIGRTGKKADEDDLRVINTGKTNLEVNATGTRFEVELQLHDKSGKTIGALGTVFAYKAGDDKAVFQKQGEKIRAEIEKKIISAGKLLEIAK